MLKLNNEKLHYAIKGLSPIGSFAFTRSYEDNITSDMKMEIPGVGGISAWFNDSKENIIKDLKACGFSDFDILKAKAFMSIDF